MTWASLEHKLDAVGYGFFIPLFFVSSGMNLDVRLDCGGSRWRRLGFFVLMFAVRGLPALFFYRHDLEFNERLQMTLLTATALPLLVALLEVGLRTGEMLPEYAAALVGAGVCSRSWSSRDSAVALRRRAEAGRDLDTEATRQGDPNPPMS